MPKRYFNNPFIGKDVKDNEKLDEKELKSKIVNIVNQIIARQKITRKDLGGY